MEKVRRAHGVVQFTSVENDPCKNVCILPLSSWKKTFADGANTTKFVKHPAVEYTVYHRLLELRLKSWDRCWQ